MPSPTSDNAENEIDTQLMLRVRAGDAKAMEALIMRHQNSVYATISGMLRNSPETEDIAQQVFINVWKAASTYEPTAKFRTWLFTIVRNQVFNEMRRLKRKPAFSADAVEDESGLVFSIDHSPTPDEAVQHKELSRAIDHAIDLLPEKSRLALRLRRYEKMSYEDIAAILGITVPATKSLLFRARSVLREHLGGFLN